ncbi:FtsK/SpoIIIE domain-containing protein [Mycolicibacterium llatzerense]|uniref:FtsK/SpoIIIE domain-containing protein n=1 Tax=Mycolicibacterium llatzerense TaxID=280871 RepID=UPI0036F1EE0C
MSDGESRGGIAQLLRSVGVDDPRVLDVDQLWANRRSRADEHWGVVPVGVNEHGELQEVIFRAKDFGGHGFHSAVIGTSGSGKSAFFETLIHGIALTHAPETFNVAYVAPQHKSVATRVAALPHVVGLLEHSGESDVDAHESMRASISDELKRRYELFAGVGARDAIEYEEIRLAGRDVEPVPILLVIIEGYAQLCSAHPEWNDLIVQIGQIGRSANVYFMLGGERLDLSSLQKAKSNIAFRIALRAEGAAESREVIGSDAAYNLPPREPGQALLKTGEHLHAFRTWSMSEAGIEPNARVGDAVREALTATGRTAPRQLFRAAG